MEKTRGHLSPHFEDSIRPASYVRPLIPSICDKVEKWELRFTWHEDELSPLGSPT